MENKTQYPGRTVYPENRLMLILSRRLNERILIGNDIEISVVEIKGDQVKIGISAPKKVKVYRQEVYQAIQEENKAALERGEVTIPSIENLFTDPSDNLPDDPSDA
jgi:carbon storage regulator